jgi:hypothetical protein
MKKVLLTFLSTNYKQKKNRLVQQARELNFYDQICMMNENDLDAGFRASHAKYLNPNVRGFGYWAWKPQIIYQKLSELNDGDILQYTDAGCHLNHLGMKRLEEYFDLANTSPSGILAFQGGIVIEKIRFNDRDLPVYVEKHWTKSDLLNHLEVEKRQDIINSPQVGAGIIFIKKTGEAMKVIESWLNIIKYNMNLVDDTKSKINEHENFKEHRHDQSVFSLIIKLNKIKCISAYEYWYPSTLLNKADWEALKYYPIHAKRDIRLKNYVKIIKNIRDARRYLVRKFFNNEHL